MRPPTHAELRRFCEVEGWEDRDKVADRKTGDHHRYVLHLADGRALYTPVSHGSGGIGDRDLWAKILRTQLEVTEEQFWACVDGGVRPPRPGPMADEPREGILAGLAWNLVTKAGVTEAEVARMSKEQAVEVWNRYLAGPT